VEVISVGRKDHLQALDRAKELPSFWNPSKVKTHQNRPQSD